MAYYPQLVTLIVLIPAIAAFINLFWGYRLPERIVGTIATAASAIAFVIAVLLFQYLSASGYQAVVIDPPLLDGWLRLGENTIVIPWQQRVDTLSVTMMLIITGVGTLIHIYSISYMHGEPRYFRYFSYLSMFLTFMLILVTGNNFLMMFVGWEGVGMASFLLIGFWFDKARGLGWRNSNAAKKAFIANRVGDFGLMLGMLLTFWTFGTLDYYTPGELANPGFGAYSSHEGDSHSEGDSHGTTTEGDHGEAAGEGAHKPFQTDVMQDHGTPATAEGDHGTAATTTDAHGAADAHGEEGAHESDHGGIAAPLYTDNEHIPTDQLGVFGQAERMIEDDAQVEIGPWTLPIGTVIGLIAFLFLIGVTGKSAQIPLFVWLPDAMAGPTPASALIHAATMVTAGVYLIVRSNVFYYEADAVSFIVTMIGASTALAGGFMAVGQWDIKRVLAYSTVSQLGFMVAAAGVGGYGAAMFHLMTHAFFKALLFLGSGSVIHAVEHGHHLAHARAHGGHGHGEGHDAPDTEEDPHDPFDPQDMRNMGGLARKMPVTYITYLIGTLALAGIFPFAGFWSKDEILVDSWLAGLEGYNIAGYLAFGMLLAAAGLTAFYMWRQIVLVFHGGPRTEAADHAPESAPLMLVPLIALAGLSVMGGFFNTPSNVLGLDQVFGAHIFSDWLGPSVRHIHVATFQLLIAVIATALAIGAMIVANRIYSHSRIIETGRDPLELNPNIAPIWRFAHARMYWDAFYDRTIVRPYQAIGDFLARIVEDRFLHDYFHDVVLFGGYKSVGTLLANPVDTGLIDGAVNGIGRLISRLSGGMRTVQTGYVRIYAITLLLGVVVVILVLLLPLLQNG
jgi:NADH-quinone oxidoreductase subunit L